jgi:hypothetical protein
MVMIQTDLAVIAALAEQHRDDNEAFGHYIDIMWDREGRADAELDALVSEIAAEVIPQIDCTACAHCCRTITIGLTLDDVPPLAAALHLTPEQVIAQVVDREAGEAHGEWGIMRGSPCPLLKDNLCAIYTHRPQACRDYPALTPDFRWLHDEMLRGVGRCPIIFNVIERLKTRLGWTDI